MISRPHRFHGLGSLNYVHRQGQVVRGRELNLKYALNPRRRNWRAAVVVSKKVSKSAVVRNRIRRRIYGALQLQAPNIDSNYDLVFQAFSPELAAMPAPELQRLVAGQLLKAGVVTSVIG